MPIRHAEPDDYAQAIAVVDEWWGGREMAAMLPKLFFVHFRDTSFVAEDDGALAGFLCGFRSQTFDDEAYIHFVGVDPAHRGGGLGRALDERPRRPHHSVEPPAVVVAPGVGGRQRVTLVVARRAADQPLGARVHELVHRALQPQRRQRLRLAPPRPEAGTPEQPLGLCFAK